MGLKSWLGYARDELVSPLPVDECIARLQEAVGGAFDDRPVVGSVGQRSLRVRQRLHQSKNSFQTYLRAALEGDGKSTRLACRFGPHPFVMVFMVFWLASALAIGAAFWTLGLPAQGGGDIPILARIAPFTMLPMGIVLLGVGRYFARGERQFLLDFLRRTIEAQPLPKSQPARFAPVVER